MALQIARLSTILRIRLSLDSIESTVVASPLVVGQELAREVDEYVSHSKLGYYPALDYFMDKDDVEAELLSALENIAWVVANMARDEIQMRLRPAFSSLHFENIQNLAYTMPTVRPGQPDALKKLAAHFTPDKIKVCLRVTLVRKKISVEAAEQFCKVMLNRWLRDRFPEIEIANIISLDRE